MTARAWALAALVAGAAATTATAQEADAVVRFDRDVAPILRKRCGNCHNAERPRGELDLSSLAGVKAGGAGGPSVAAGNPEDSPLYTLAAHLETPKMPPNAPKIPQREIDTIRRWIEGGLVESTGDASPPSARIEAPAKGGLVAIAEAPRASAITALAVDPKSPIAAVSGMRQVLLFDLATAGPIGALDFPEGDVLALRFSADGRALLAAGGMGGASGRAALFDTATWARIAAVGDEPDAILDAALAPGSDRIVVGGPTRAVKILDASSGEAVHTFRKPTDWVTAVGFGPDGLLVAAGDRFGGLFLWDAREGREFLALRGHDKAVTAIGWSADGDRLVTAGDDGTLRGWDLHAGKPSWRREAHAGGVLGLDVHPVSGRIATAGRDRQVRIWSPSGEPEAALGPLDDQATRVAWTADGRSLVAGDASGAARIWSPGSSDSLRLPIPVAARPMSVAVVAPDLAPARPFTPPARPVAANARPAPGDLEGALAAAREAAISAERSALALGRLLAAGKPAGDRADALRAATAALESLRLAIAAAPDDKALPRALAEVERAVRSLGAEPVSP